jgi:AraC-like DNA-binding protein
MSWMGHMGQSTRGIDYQDVPRPVAGLATQYPSGFVDPRHSHARAQLTFPATGVTTVTTDSASFIIPAGKAMWLPAGVEHEVSCKGDVEASILYVSHEAASILPNGSRVVQVSPLMTELIIEASHLAVDYEMNSRDGRVMALLLDELGRADAASISAPMPRHPRLARVCATILKDPSADDDLDAWASAAGMGRRTFTRTFRRETGVSFAVWRQNVRLMDALSLLSAGQSVTSVAYDVGYSSPSAFTAMFRRAFGVAPTAYLSSEPDG